MINIIRHRAFLIIYCAVSTSFVCHEARAFDPTLKSSLDECRVLVTNHTLEKKTADFCGDAEAKIRGSSPNTQEHVQALELLALLAGYNQHVGHTADRYYKLALQAAQAGFGDRSPETIEPLVNLAALSLKSNDWQSAREMSLKALDATGKQHSVALEENHKSSLEAIITSFRIEKKLSPETYRIVNHIQAEANLVDALTLWKVASLVEREEIGIALLEVGNLQMEAGMLEEAARSTQRAHSALIETRSGNWVIIARNQLEKIVSMRDSGQSPAAK